MDQGLIPKRYAKALYLVAAEKGDTTRLYDRLGDLTKAFDAEPKLDLAIKNPFVSNNDKAKLIYTAANSDPSDVALADFIKLLINNKRIDMVREIATAYQDIYRQHNKIYRVEVIAAAPMDTAEQDRLKNIILKHLDGGKMEFTMRIDPEIIGGFVVKIDNQRLDASVANQLKQLRHNFHSN